MPTKKITKPRHLILVLEIETDLPDEVLRRTRFIKCGQNNADAYGPITVLQAQTNDVTTRKARKLKKLD